jgi:hypothetical protein
MRLQQTFGSQRPPEARSNRNGQLFRQRPVTRVARACAALLRGRVRVCWRANDAEY